jgi:hypothetical protein
MKKAILFFVLVFAGVQLMSQSSNDYIEILRSVLKTEKKAAISEVMNFTDQEAEVFWPLYNEFTEKMYVVQGKRVKIIKDYAENYSKMTDEKADELWTSAMSYRQETLKLTKQYYKKFKKILPAGKAARYFQAENKIATLIDFELASEIPMIEVD